MAANTTLPANYDFRAMNSSNVVQGGGLDFLLTNPDMCAEMGIELDDRNFMLAFDKIMPSGDVKGTVRSRKFYNSTQGSYYTKAITAGAATGTAAQVTVTLDTTGPANWGGAYYHPFYPGQVLQVGKSALIAARVRSVVRPGSGNTGFTMVLDRLGDATTNLITAIPSGTLLRDTGNTFNKEAGYNKTGKQRPTKIYSSDLQIIRTSCPEVFGSDDVAEFKVSSDQGGTGVISRAMGPVANHHMDEVSLQMLHGQGSFFPTDLSNAANMTGLFETIRAFGRRAPVAVGTEDIDDLLDIATFFANKGYKRVALRTSTFRYNALQAVIRNSNLFGGGAIVYRSADQGADKYMELHFKGIHLVGVDISFGLEPMLNHPEYGAQDAADVIAGLAYVIPLDVQDTATSIENQIKSVKAPAMKIVYGEGSGPNTNRKGIYWKKDPSTREDGADIFQCGMMSDVGVRFFQPTNLYMMTAA